MTTESFLTLWADTELRQYLVNVAKSFTRDKALQEDLLQEAWLRISQEGGDKTSDYYKAQGFKGMDVAYRKEIRAVRLERWGKQHDALRKRVRYTENKHIDSPKKP